MLSSRVTVHGGRLNRSHGYGGELLTHLALQGERERAERSRALVPRRVQKEVATLADRAGRDREAARSRAEANKARLHTMPEDIYLRELCAKGK
jgi:hypothetical protein